MKNLETTTQSNAQKLITILHKNRLHLRPLLMRDAIIVTSRLVDVVDKMMKEILVNSFNDAVDAAHADGYKAGEKNAEQVLRFRLRQPSYVARHEIG